MILSLLRSGPVAIIFAFLFIFGAPVEGVPFNTAKVTLLIAMCVFVLMLMTSWSRGELRLAPAPLYIAAAVSFLLMFYSVVMVVANQTADFSLSYNLLILTFENILGSYIFFRVFLNGRSLSQLLDVFIWVGVIQSLIIVAMFSSLSFRELVFHWFANEEIIEMSARYGGIRGFGIAGSVTYDLSVLLSIFMMFSAYQISNTSRSQLFYIFAWLLCFISVMVSGRTGFLGVFLSLVILLRFSHRPQAFIGMIKLFMIALVCVLLSLILLHSRFPEVWVLINEVVIPYAFEMFFSAAEGDGFNTKSTEILQKMYFPVENSTFWFGDARWLGDGGIGYYMHTDAGYMRHILFYGVFGSLILYLLYGGLFSYLYRACERKWKFLILAIAGYVFIVHLKGDFLVGSSMNIKVFFLLFAFAMLVQRNGGVKKSVV